MSFSGKTIGTSRSGAIPTGTPCSPILDAAAERAYQKEQTGEGLSAALHRIRFNQAVKLLRETEETIDVIALHCGYVNPSSFRRAFRQRYSLSPSAYKVVKTAS
jgi:transcriptional regulator GlxA family with amidase domain